MKPLMPEVKCGTWSLSVLEGSLVSKATFTILQFGGYCSQCTFRVIESLEKAASELRSAAAGGVWEEERMEVEDAAKTR